jgi:hypothetical protein
MLRSNCTCENQRANETEGSRPERLLRRGVIKGAPKGLAMDDEPKRVEPEIIPPVPETEPGRSAPEIPPDKDAPEKNGPIRGEN